MLPKLVIVFFAMLIASEPLIARNENVVDALRGIAKDLRVERGEVFITVKDKILFILDNDNAITLNDSETIVLKLGFGRARFLARHYEIEMIKVSSTFRNYKVIETMDLSPIGRANIVNVFECKIGPDGFLPAAVSELPIGDQGRSWRFWMSFVVVVFLLAGLLWRVKLKFNGSRTQ